MNRDTSTGPSVLTDLAATIAGRRGRSPETSYTATLLDGGPETCARKFGEEAVEFIVASLGGNRDRVVSEAADVLYHLLVALEAGDVALDDVFAELARRQGIGGHEEKAARNRTTG